MGARSTADRAATTRARERTRRGGGGREIHGRGVVVSATSLEVSCRLNGLSGKIGPLTVEQTNYESCLETNQRQARHRLLSDPSSLPGLSFLSVELLGRRSEYVWCVRHGRVAVWRPCCVEIPTRRT